MRKIQTRFYRVLLSLVLVSLLFLGTTVAIGFKYDISPYYVAREIARQSILTAIHFSTAIYDPTTVKNTITGSFDSDYMGYIRFEDFAEKGGLPRNFRLEDIQNEKITTSRFHFSYQPYAEPRLAVLRKKYRLDDVIASAKDEFQAMVLLRNWARSQFQSHDYQPISVNFDALEILERNYKNDSRKPWEPGFYDPCYSFPLLYTQVMLSMGHQARPVRISHLSVRSERGYDGHGMTEVWSNQFRKWITMDVDQNLHYEKDGIPLNLLEVHNARYTKGHSKIKVIRGIQTSGDFDSEKDLDLRDLIDYHSYFEILDMRNDWMTNHYFRGHPKRSDQSTLFWIDENLPPVFNFKQTTNNVDDFYWTVNQIEILVNRRYSKGVTIPLAFKTFTPNFKHFELTLDRSETIVLENPFYDWQLHPGKNELRVVSLNKFGVHGVPSSVQITLNVDE